MREINHIREPGFANTAGGAAQGKFGEPTITIEESV
jgi:hypothetical protein